MSLEKGDTAQDARPSAASREHPVTTPGNGSGSPLQLPLRELIVRLRDRRLRSSSLVQALLANIQAQDPRLHMVIHRRDEQVLLEAQEADRRLDAGQPRGPLEGLPVTIKDTLDTAGILTSSACLHRKARVPEADATTVGRWRRAGALVLAKSSAPELAYSLETANLLVGRTRNPWSRGHSVSGSSGGEAALLATHGSVLGLGTDLAGSLRLPAHCCGVASLKPSRGSLPLDGHPPNMPVHMHSLPGIGPMARSVEDLEVGWLALTERWTQLETLLAGKSSPALLPSAQIRVLFSRDPMLTRPCHRGLELAVQRLERAGHQLEITECDALAEAPELWRQLVACDGGRALRQCLRDGVSPTWLGEGLRVATGRATRHPLTLLTVMASYFWAGPDRAWLEARIGALTAGLEAFFQPNTFALLPVAPGTAHRAWNLLALLPMLRYVSGANVFGLPALVVPVVRGRPGQLPVGIQLMGPLNSEDALLKLGICLEQGDPAWGNSE